MTVRFYMAAMILAACFCADIVQAAEAKNVADYPVLEKLQSGDEKLDYDYLGEKYGMDAWLLSGPDLMQVIYVLPQEKAALVGGTLVNPDGKEASTTLLQDFLKQNPERAEEILQHVRSEVQAQQNPENKTPDVQKNPSPSENFWRNLVVINGIVYGDNKDAPVIFAVLDPVQAETKVVWNVLAPLAEKGHVQLHVMPLAATSADSIMDVAAVLGHENPQEAWREVMDGKKMPVNTTPEAHGVLRMKSIVEMAQALNLRKLPLLVYRVGKTNENAGTVRIVRGTPKDWVGVFKDMGMGETAR